MLAASVERGRKEVWQQDRIGCHNEKFVIVAENHNLVWLESELDVVLSMWEEGRHISDIAETLKRPEYELGYLLIYLDTPIDSKQGQEFRKRFRRRPTGVYGAN